MRRMFMKKRNKILCGFLVLSLIIGTAVPSRATIKDEKDKLNNLQNEQEDVQQQINGLEKSKADAKTFINTVDSQVSAISKQMYDNENELDKTEKKIKKNEKKLENAQTSIENQYAAMKLRIQFMYENGDTQMLDLILSSKSVGDFLNKAEYISEISSYDRKMLNKMKETKQEIADTQVALEDSKTNLENLQTKQKRTAIRFINSFDCKIHKKDSVFRILFSCYKLSYRITSYTNGTSFGGVSEKTYADSSSSFAGAKKEVSSV